MTATSNQRELQDTRAAAASCTACPLWEIGTQTVFGVGPVDADVMFIGEAPGRQEDEAGQPFVGPAGRLFSEVLQEAGIDRATVYVTNTVKHRPWVDSDGRQKNRAPRQREINACAKWLDDELRIVRPRIVCCLGAVAAKRILGRSFRLMEQRGTWLTDSEGRQVLATVHPSFVMLQRADSRERWRRTLVNDLELVRASMGEPGAKHRH